MVADTTIGDVSISFPSSLIGNTNIEYYYCRIDDLRMYKFNGMPTLSDPGNFKYYAYEFTTIQPSSGFGSNA